MNLTDVAVGARLGLAVLRGCLTLLMLALSTATLAAGFSDLLILLDADGRGYTAQHTLASEGELLVVPLPEDRISLDTRFSGPEWLTFSAAHDRNPAQLALWSGSALTRYRHRYGSGLTQPEPGIYQLDSTQSHAHVRSEDPENLQWSLTWILPDRAELLSFNSRDEDRAGRWSSSGTMISYQQQGGPPPELTLRFALPGVADRQLAQSVCRFPDALSDACSPDIDGDEVPDYRDICLPADSQVVAVAAPEKLATPLSKKPDPHTSVAMSALGCERQSKLVLSGIRFESGQSYLNVASRQVLDRVARSLQRLPDTRFEFGIHTDNAGRVEHNQALSESRARTVRQYLMLRGIPRSQIRVRGFGESEPLYDPGQAAGRRANRRVELTAVTD